MIKRKHKNSIVFLLIVFLFLAAGFASAQTRQLEIDYPEVGGIQPTGETSVGELLLYWFNFAIWVVGAVVLLVVVIAGIRYITSTGKPEQLEGARRQILSAFWGTIILLGAYILLSTINPQLLVLGPGELKDLPSPDKPDALQVIYSTPTEDLLKRIKRFAEVVQAMPAKINTTAKEIETDTNKCSCGNTKSLCLCTGGSPSDTCKPLFCYTGLDQKVGDIVSTNGETFHPCPEAERIQKNQKKIVDQGDVILYYRNRALSERDDLKDLDQDLNSDLEFLGKTRRWYRDTIDNNQQLASQTEGSDEQFYQAIIEILQERLGWLDEEIDYKEQVKDRLEELARAIKLIEEPITKLGALPDECVKRVSDTNVCQATCVPSNFEYGCFDKRKGCEPAQCKGDNPCPTDLISKNVGAVRSIGGNIKSIAKEIIRIIDLIPETRSVNTQL